MECWSKPPSSVVKIHLATRVWLIVRLIAKNKKERKKIVVAEESLG